MKRDRADILVFKQGLTDSREKAKRLIMAGQVYVEEVKVQKPGESFYLDTVFNIRGEGVKYVSRGGYKLEKAIDFFNLNLKDKVCADFGASTGGFTDCMLQNGANKVYALDVGYNQLDYKIRSDSKVETYERTNIRHLPEDFFSTELDFISIDVSFISLELILPKAFENIKDNGQIVALIKPQFEADREDVGKGGIIKDSKIHIKVISKIFDFVNNSNFNLTGLTYSPIKGTNGNIEYLALIEKNGANIDKGSITSIVNQSKSLGD